MALDDRQNIIVAGVNSLNEALTKAKTNRLQKEALHRQLGSVTADTAGVDTFPVLSQNTTIQEIKQQIAVLNADKARLLQTADRESSRRREAQRAARIGEPAAAAARPARSCESIGNDYRNALAEEQNLSRSLDEQKQQAIILNRKNINFSILQREAEGERHVYNALLQQEKEMRVVSNSRANNVQLDGCGGSAGWTVYAESRPRLADGAGAGPGARRRLRVHGRVSRRHGQDSRRRHAPAQAAAARSGAGGRRRQGAGAPQSGAARLRRGVPVAAHLAGVHQRHRRQADDRGDQHAAARRQDDDGVQPGGRARARRLAGDADRRGHAPPGPAPHDGPAERGRAVARAHRARRASAKRSSARASRTSTS